MFTQNIIGQVPEAERRKPVQPNKCAAPAGYKKVWIEEYLDFPHIRLKRMRRVLVPLAPNELNEAAA